MVVADLASMHTTSLLVYHGEKANKQDGTVRIMPSCRVRVWATRQRAHILHLCTAVDLSLACVVQCNNGVYEYHFSAMVFIAYRRGNDGVW